MMPPGELPPTDTAPTDTALADTGALATASIVVRAVRALLEGLLRVLVSVRPRASPSGRSAGETTLVFRGWQVIWQPATGTSVLGDTTGELEGAHDRRTRSTLGGYAAWDEDATGEPATPAWLVQPGTDCPRALMLVHCAHRGD